MSRSPIRCRATREEIRPDRLFVLIAPSSLCGLRAANSALSELRRKSASGSGLADQFIAVHRRAARCAVGWRTPHPGLGEATVREIGSVVPLAEPKIIRRPISEIFARNTPIGSDQNPIYYDFFGSVVYSPVGYLPQIFAVQIGKSANLSVEWTLRLGRLLNLVLCIGLVVWALKLVPFGRWLMLIIALSPPVAAGAASSARMLSSMAEEFLLTAGGLKIAAEKRWTGSRAAVVGLAGVAVSVAKFAYLPSWQ